MKMRCLYRDPYNGIFVLMKNKFFGKRVDIPDTFLSDAFRSDEYSNQWYTVEKWNSYHRGFAFEIKSILLNEMYK